MTKGEGEWQHLKPAILGAIMEHFMSGERLLEGESSQQEQSDDEEFFDDKDARHGRDHQGIARDAAFALPSPGDGGDITFRGFQGWHRLPDHEGLLLGLPLVHGHAEAWHPEPASPLPAGRAGSPVGLTACCLRGRLGGGPAIQARFMHRTPIMSREPEGMNPGRRKAVDRKQ